MTVKLLPLRASGAKEGRDSESEDAPSSGPPYGGAYRRYALFLLIAVYFLGQVDRGLMILLLEPIKRDLGLSDTQLGFVTGIAFGATYAIAGIPIARWADRDSRARVASIAVAIWSLTVMSAIIIGNYVQLVLARLAAAIGEAGGKPPTYALIGDYYPQPEQRTRALGLYLAGAPLAALVSFLAGGWLAGQLGWKWTFFVAGIPGLALAVIVYFTLKDPRRVGQVRSANIAPPPIAAVGSTLWRNRSLRHLTFAFVVIYTQAQGLAPWYAAFMMRSHGMGTAELGLWLGLTLSVGGIVGAIGGGYVASRWFAANERGQMALSALFALMLMPLYLLFLTVRDKHLALLLLTFPMIALFIFQGPAYSLMQRLVPDTMRATMMAVVMLIANLIGMGLGPQIVGIVSDALRPRMGDESLRYAMLAMSFLGLAAAYHFYRVSRSVADDLQAVEPPPATGGTKRA